MFPYVCQVLTSDDFPSAVVKQRLEDKATIEEQVAEVSGLEDKANIEEQVAEVSGLEDKATIEEQVAEVSEGAERRLGECHYRGRGGHSDI